MTQAVVIGSQPHPRVLLVCETDDSLEQLRKIANDVEDIVPTARLCTFEQLEAVRQETYDLALVLGGRPKLVSGLHVVQIGGGYAGGSHEWFGEGVHRARRSISITRRDVSFSTEWIVPTRLESEHQALVQRDLVPLVPRGNIVPEKFDGSTLCVHLERFEKWFEKNHYTPLLHDLDESAVAIRYVLEDHYNWVLPEHADAASWLRLVIRYLNHIQPESFPISSTWADNRIYLTARELSIQDAFRELDAERSSFESTYARRLRDLAAQADAARDEGEQGLRRLVTATGDALVGAVAEALVDIGMYVTVSDDTAEKGDKLEDLRVRLGRTADALALVEVRSYKGGAQLGDLLRLSRFVNRFVQAEGRAPDRQWYVANQFVGRGPDDQVSPLISNPNEVAIFAEDHGLVIGSHQLLQLCLRVERGEMTAESARTLLWESTGYLQLPDSG